MTSPVLMTIYNTTSAQLDLTKQAIKSVLAQDVGPLLVHIEDDGSAPETCEWFESAGWLEFEHHPETLVNWRRREKNISPMKITNELLPQLFRVYPYVFLVGSDVILPPNCFSEFLKWPRGVVTGVDIGQNMPDTHPGKPVSEGMLMNVMLLRKWAWEALIAKDGYFYDPNIIFYVSDCDLAIRFAACGIRGIQLDTPYWHYGSATHRLAAPGIGKSITDQADKDRQYFKEKWGFACDSPEYGKQVNREIRRDEV